MFSPRPTRRDCPATRTLVGINIAIFLLQVLAGPRWFPVLALFGLWRETLLAGEVWQLVTYQFLHANELHIFVNMVGLWFLGRELERVIGTPRFLTIYLVGGAVAGLAQVFLDPSPGVLIGASGSVCAILLAFTTMFPRLEVTALLLFIIPVRARAATLGWGIVGVSVLFWLSGLAPGIGHLAHLGGFAAGALFGFSLRGQYASPAEFDPPEDTGGGWFPPRRGPTGPPLPPPAVTSWETLRGLPTVEQILDKVLRHGIESLTREERRILEESRRPRRWD